MANDTRIVYNKLLGAYYIVRGAHQSPLGGPFKSKAEAEHWKEHQQRIRDERGARMLGR